MIGATTGIVADLRRRVDALGWPGVAGIVLAVFSAAAWVSGVVPAIAERDLLQLEADKVERRHRGAASAAERAPTAPEQLATFYAFFPAAPSTPDWLGRIHAAAVAKGLTLASGEYKVDKAGSPRLARYQITLPVQGTYPQIRGFIGAVLAEVPAAVIEEVSLKRESVESARLDARIRITLYLAAPRGPESGA
jgi:Tfp pilus assembly protein PilO